MDFGYWYLLVIFNEVDLSIYNVDDVLFLFWMLECCICRYVNLCNDLVVMVKYIDNCVVRN